ncbi:MAG TPA: hypothetical protein VHL57_07915 [Flavobacteriales bacterium]|jgi:hypothetical protein|nr:hypothetical protein [Flavobacteriales bacterium]
MMPDQLPGGGPAVRCLLISLLLVGACGRSTKPTAASADCLLVHEGEFTYSPDGKQVIHVSRKGEEQVEHTPDNTTAHHLRIRWVDACSYLMFDPHILRGGQPDADRGHDTVLVRILQVGKAGYDYEARLNRGSLTWEGRVFFGSKIPDATDK